MEGPVYKMKCEECDAAYVGETERSLKPSLVNISYLAWPPQIEVSKHIHVDHPNFSMELENIDILTTAPKSV